MTTEYRTVPSPQKTLWSNPFVILSPPSLATLICFLPLQFGLFKEYQIKEIVKNAAFCDWFSLDSSNFFFINCLFFFTAE
jgi:hypothetical protein